MHHQAGGVNTGDGAIEGIADRLFRLEDGGATHEFAELAELIVGYQRERNPVYGRYCKAIGDFGEQLFPYLPIAAFKESPVTCYPPEQAERVFESSGTGSGRPSRHYVRDLRLYERAIDEHFRRVFGEAPFVLAAHLPHYAEMGSRSSLLYMVDYIRVQMAVLGSRSFLEEPERLSDFIELSEQNGVPLVVIGAAFGLLQLVEHHPCQLPANALVIETGGMKTYRREINRTDLHERLAAGFGVDRGRIYSEYGMCELLSQCYTRGDEIFLPPPWMRIQVLDPEDPFREVDEGKVGVLAVLDLANIHTVSPILTEDRAVRIGDGFAVLGRLSGAELRGCNFLLENV